MRRLFEVVCVLGKRLFCRIFNKTDVGNVVFRAFARDNFFNGVPDGNACHGGKTVWNAHVFDESLVFCTQMDCAAYIQIPQPEISRGEEHVFNEAGDVQRSDFALERGGYDDQQRCAVQGIGVGIARLLNDLVPNTRKDRLVRDDAQVQRLVSVHSDGGVQCRVENFFDVVCGDRVGAEGAGGNTRLQKLCKVHRNHLGLIFWRNTALIDIKHERYVLFFGQFVYNRMRMGSAAFAALARSYA